MKQGNLFLRNLGQNNYEFKGKKNALGLQNDTVSQKQPEKNCFMLTQAFTSSPR